MEKHKLTDRRRQPRMWCADLADVSWTDVVGQRHRVVANLEDISLTGARIQMDRPIPLGLSLRMECQGTRLEGQVRHCSFRETGYFLGIEFAPACREELGRLRPQHLLDPRRLIYFDVEAALRKK